MKNMIAVLIVSTAPLITPTGSWAVTVGLECAQPTNEKHNSFYVDPSAGSMKNDGSVERPWKTLEEVLDDKSKLIDTQSYPGDYKRSDKHLSDKSPGAPIKSGDTIYLMSGDHGDVKLARAINSEFITVKAAPNNTPKLRSLQVLGASKWIFDGLTFQSFKTNVQESARALVHIGRNDWWGPTDNIVLMNSSFSSVNDASQWSDQDWIQKPFESALIASADCTTIANNHFYNVKNAIFVGGNRSVVIGNRIDHFSNDGIDLVGSDLVVRQNVITHSQHSPINRGHPDAIQGWTVGNKVNSNIVIDGNMIMNYGDSNNLQGITIFDGKWDGVTISNNVVVTNHWHGITMMGVDGLKIINNTVVPSDPSKHPTWILVQDSKDGRPTRNATIRNNISADLAYSPTADIEVDHNIVSRKITKLDRARGNSYLSRPGTYGDHNMVSPEIVDGFVSVDRGRQRYDLRLKENSPAVRSGNDVLAPSSDIRGKKRSRPVDVGAYVY